MERCSPWGAPQKPDGDEPVKSPKNTSALSEDNTQSWVRNSHGSNKFVIDSNNNNTESPEDLPEEQGSQLKVFAARSKAKTKPQRRKPVDYSPSIIPMNADE